MRRAIVSLLTLVLVLACGPSRSPESKEPAPTGALPGPEAPPEPKSQAQPQPQPQTTDSACDTHREALYEQQCGDEPDCEGSEFTCGLGLDLDGDGDEDRVEITRKGDALALRVIFAAGHESLVGAGETPLTEAPDLGQAMAPPSSQLAPDWSWLAAWGPAPRDGDTLVHGRLRLPAGPALGDGLWLSSTDSAAMLVLTEDGWLVIQLGY